MRILFIDPSFYSNRIVSGGMEKYLWKLICGLKKRHSVSILIPQEYNVSIKDVSVYYYIRHPNQILSYPISLLSFFITFTRIVIRERPQIVSNFLPNLGTAIVFPLAKIFGMKTFLNFRGFPEDPSSLLTRLIYVFNNITYFFTDGLIANAKELFSKYQKVILFGHDFYKSIPKYYVPNAIKASFWRVDLSNRKLSYDLCFSGNIYNKKRIELKGIRYLFQALKLIDSKHKKKLRVLMLGEYSLAALKKNIENFSPEYFEFKGLIKNRSELRTYYASSKIFVLSSISEGMPNALMESLSVGVPCISSDVGAIRDLIDNGVNGFVIPAKNSAELSEKIWLLLNDLPMQKRFILMSQEKMAKKFSWKHNILNVERLYSSFINNNK